MRNVPDDTENTWFVSGGTVVVCKDGTTTVTMTFKSNSHAYSAESLIIASVSEAIKDQVKDLAKLTKMVLSDVTHVYTRKPENKIASKPKRAKISAE